MEKKETKISKLLNDDIIQQSGGTLFLKVSRSFLGLVTSLVLARVLGVEEYGIYSYAMSWVVMAKIPGNMGLTQLQTREVSKYTTRERWGLLRGLLEWSDRVLIKTNLGLLTLGAGILLLIGEHLTAGMETALWLSMPLLPLIVFARIRQAGLRGLGDVVKGQIPLMLILPITFLSLIGVSFLLYEMDSGDALIMRCAATLVALLCAHVMLRLAVTTRLESVTKAYKSSYWLKSAVPLLFAGSSNTFRERIPILILGSLVSPGAVGVFSIASKGSLLAKFALEAINMPLGPKAASLYSRDKMKELQNIFTIAARATLVASVPFLIVFFVWGETFLGLFGEGFQTGKTALVILCSGQVVSAGVGSVGLILNMTDNELQTALGVTVGGAVNMILCIVLVPYMGLEGAAIATASSVITQNIWFSVMVFRKTGLMPGI